MIIIQGLNLLHKIKRTQEPESLYEMFNNPTRPIRCETKLYTKYTPKTNQMRKFLIYKITDLYNNLDPDFHNMTVKKIKNDINYNVPIAFPHPNIPDTHDISSDTDSN